MAQGKKTPNVPNESDMIQMKDAAVFFNVKPPAITQWKNSGRYRGFYNVNGKPKVYLPELIESRIANAISENQNGGGGDFEEELKAIEKEKARAAARKVIRSDQIEDGKTIYVDDIVMGFDEIASKFRSEIKAIGPHLAQQMIEYFSAFLLQAVDDDPKKVDAVAEALQKVDMRAFARKVSETANETLGPIGESVSEIIPNAIERSRKA